MIIRSNKEKWTTVDNIWVKDKTLSAKAKGILLYILSLPDDWDLHITELTTHFIDGIDSIRSGIIELRELGYISLSNRRDAEGKIVGWDYIIYESLQTDFPDVEKPDVEKPPLLSTKEKLNTNKTIVVSPEIKEIIAYLNEKMEFVSPKGFKPDNKRTVRDLNARLKSYSVKDVKAVIDVKYRKWKDTEWEMYLRPITLFNVNKFESYINEIDVEGSESRCDGATPLQELQ